MAKKIGFVSLGCPKNLVDGEVMLGLAEQAGHEITSVASDADVLVINTCAFIDQAKQESIDAILEMAEHKKTGRARRLIVTGCLGERYRDELKKEIPEIDVILGTGEVPEIVRAIDVGSGVQSARHRVHVPVVGPGSGVGTAPLTFHRPETLNRTLNSQTGAQDFAPRHQLGAPRATSRGGPGIPDPTSRPTYIYDADTPRHLSTPGHFAYVKVAEGCDYTCSFCIIPTLRGRYRSRTAGSILHEARRLAERGVKELILISQDTTFYGNDRGERGALPQLLRALNEVDGLEWIRLLYLYPTTISDETIGAIADCEKVCRYVDLPLQHASTTVLKRMGRPGNRGTYEKLLHKIRDRVPGVTLRTTFIVGYPGETESEFDELCSFVRDVRFDHLGVFTYSHEDGTRAFSSADDVRASVKRRRRERVMDLQRDIVASAQQGRVGARARVLVDGPSSEHELVLQGRLEGQAPEIDPVVYLTECDISAVKPGDFVDVDIVDARGYDLLVRPVCYNLGCS